jgi:hypothetical protein
VVHVRQRANLWREIAGVDAVDLEPASREREHGTTRRRPDLDRDLPGLDRQLRPRDRLLDLGVRARGRIGRHVDRDRTARVWRARGVVPVDPEPRGLALGEDHVGDELAVGRRSARPECLPWREIDRGLGVAREDVHAIHLVAGELYRRGHRISRRADGAPPHAREHRGRGLVRRDRARRLERDEPRPRVREPQIRTGARDLELDRGLDAGQTGREHELSHAVDVPLLPCRDGRSGEATCDVPGRP